MTETINNVYDLPSIEPKILYLHTATGFPTKRTWIKSIKSENYLTWPFLTIKNVNKYFPESEETHQGHMQGQRQGVQSTKVNIKTEDDDDEKEGDEKQVDVKLHEIYIKVYDPKETMYTDQNGKFPVVSSRGNKYMMLLVDVDSGSIWAEAMKNRKEGEMIQASRRSLLRMKLCETVPKQ